MRDLTVGILGLGLLVAGAAVAAEWPLQRLAEGPRVEEGEAVAALEEPATEAEGGSEEAEPEWDVADPPGDETEVVIDTTEGTWMNLDVSPTGEEIVFDLLGDLYVLPIEGGEATALTSGLEWDMQPRFSPDGRRSQGT